MYFTKLWQVKKDLPLKHLTCPPKSVLYVLASQASQTNLQQNPENHPLSGEVAVMIARSEALRQGRPLAGKTGRSQTGWQQNQRRGARCPVSPLWEATGRGRVACTFGKFLRAEHIGPFVAYWKQGRWSSRYCVLLSWWNHGLTQPVPCVRAVQGGGTCFAHLQPHTLFRCAFQLLFDMLGHQLSQSIATISAGYFLSHRKQNKQNHWKLRTGSGSVGKHCKRIKNHTAAPPVAAAAKWVLMCFFV